jgi:hypothetical protein
MTVTTEMTMVTMGRLMKNVGAGPMSAWQRKHETEGARLRPWFVF